MNAWTRRFAAAALAALAGGFASGPLRAQDAAGTVTQRVRESQDAAAQGDLERARTLAGQAVALDPAHAPAWRQQGVVLLKSDRAPDAAVSLRRAVELDAGDVAAWRALGQAAWKSERQHEAARALGE